MHTGSVLIALMALIYDEISRQSNRWNDIFMLLSCTIFFKSITRHTLPNE